ncbi:MAG: hypothetical protein QOG82_763 [Actinomycetota bacterium]|jgi:tetratricopeptide (TPR) repeat protein|nr:hypothetical protein [Actinomycetota bacterium]
MSEELAGLEEQRDVLLKSLRDLEQERASGEIGDDDYTVLKDDYTARAAAVLKAIEAGRSVGVRRPRGRSAGGRPRQPPAVRAAANRAAAAGTNRPTSRRPRPSTEVPAPATRADADTRPVGDRPATAATDTAAATAATDTAPATGADTAAATGATDTAAAAGATDAAAGTRAVGSRQAAARRRANPPVPRRQRTVAVSLIVVFAIVALAGVSVVLFSDGRTGDEPITGSVPDATTAVDGRVDDALALETEGKAVEALQLYDEILASDPDNVEALAYRGWLLKRAGLADEALASLDRAVAVDPTFADAHFFRGMVLYQDRDDPAGAVIEFQAFLANNPPPDFVDAVGEVLAQAQAAAAAKATTPTPTTTAP